MKNETAEKPVYHGIIALDWGRVVQILCAYGYRFGLQECGPIPAWGLWEKLLKIFGGRSTRQLSWHNRDITDRADQFRLTHYCIGHIVDRAQKQLACSDVWELGLDYTGMGTAFFKTDVRIVREKSWFVVTIMPAKFDPELETRLADITGMMIRSNDR